MSSSMHVSSGINDERERYFSQMKRAVKLAFEDLQGFRRLSEAISKATTAEELGDMAEEVFDYYSAHSNAANKAVYMELGRQIQAHSDSLEEQRDAARRLHRKAGPQ